MLFKNTIILFVLYFVTATQSIGLNMDHVKKIVQLFRPNEELSIIPMEGIVSLLDDFDVNNCSSFIYNEDLPDARKVQDLLVFLANYDKLSDDWWKESILSSYEVRVYVGVFNTYDQKGNHDGLLDYNEVKQVIDVFNLNDADKNRLAEAFDKNDLAINAADFLLGFMKEKTEGRGLDVNRIQELIDLYNNHKTAEEHINSDKIREIFTKLSIVKNDHEGQLLVFDQIRTAALELQELSVVTAEHNKDVDAEAESLLTTAVVRYLIWEFSIHDKNKNGFLDVAEFKKLSKHHFRDEECGFVIRQFDADNDNQLHIAEFFMAVIKTYLEAGHNV